MLQPRALPGEPVAAAAGFAAPAPQVDACRGPERQLLEAVRRAGRSPQGRMALVLHLSRLARPGPRPHHRRIARVILDDTAQRHEGQVFTLGNGDMVLLCRIAPEARALPARPVRALTLPDPIALPDTLAALLRVDLPDPSLVTTVWSLPEKLAALTAYAVDRTAETGPAEPPPPPGPGLARQTRVVDAIAAIAEAPAIAEFMQRQVGVLMPPPRLPGVPDDLSLQPLYRELGFSISALEAYVNAAGQAVADPFLFRHLAFRLDWRMLALLADAAGTGGVLDIAAGGPGTAPLHINMTLPGILSNRFARVARLCRSFAAPIGIEVALIEACADPAAFERARRVLHDAGLKLVLDSVSHLALMLARPGALQPDMVKLDWSPALPDLPLEERLRVAVALERLGPDRVVLHKAETEAALRWGLAQGIRRFQGRHVDAMLAAGRGLACPRTAHCTLRQCIERAASVGPSGRAGCDAAGLLDGVPAPLPVGSGESRGFAA